MYKSKKTTHIQCVKISQQMLQNHALVGKRLLFFFTIVIEKRKEEFLNKKETVKKIDLRLCLGR